jgi:phosphopantothenoylcysteine decarboxylase/phosphopantothenate--cysteine ligase
VAARALRPFVVGFAAETDSVEQYARQKLLKKNLDMIAANEVIAARWGWHCPGNGATIRRFVGISSLKL